MQSRQVASGGYYAPRFAPDGRQLLVTGSKQRGLYLAGAADGAVRRLNDDEAAGVHARFRPDGAIEFRAVRAGEKRDLAIGQDGAARAPSASVSAAAPLAVEQDDRIYVRGADGRLAQVGSGDRFFSPVVSPDGGKVVFQGLVTGLYVYDRAKASLVHIGPGTAPAWSPDGGRLVYELTEDDGHDIVSSELHLYDLAAARGERLTSTDRQLERRPSFSPDGQQIAFDDDTGGIWIARLAEVQR